jgi:hypothetical protein
MLGQESISLDGLRWMLPTGEAMPPELAHSGCSVTRTSAW